jgi:hypothetical protein
VRLTFSHCHSSLEPFSRCYENAYQQEWHPPGIPFRLLLFISVARDIREHQFVSAPSPSRKSSSPSSNVLHGILRRGRSKERCFRSKGLARSVGFIEKTGGRGPGRGAAERVWVTLEDGNPGKTAGVTGGCVSFDRGDLR